MPEIIRDTFTMFMMGIVLYFIIYILPIYIYGFLV